MERLGVLVHPTRPVQDGVEILERWTLERDLELVQIQGGEQPVVAPAGEATVCDLIVALGGDGTILKALHLSARTRTPVMGVAYGSLGALTTVPTDELPAGLDRFVAGGSLLAPGTNGFLCTPLAMHGGCAPPLVVADGAEVTLDVHPGRDGFDVEVDGFRLETDAQRFSVGSEQAYATLVSLEDTRTGLPRLRERGLISDSPRVTGRDRRRAHLEPEVWR